MSPTLRDFNFIHINPYFLNYASLPDTITTRGLWSSAATRRYVENVVAKGRPDALGHSVSSVGIVLAGDKLAVKPWHTAMRSPLRSSCWEGVDAHLLAKIHFRGIKSQAIRGRYMDVSYNTMNMDGDVKTSLFADSDDRTPKYTPSHPNNLLLTTQFAQIALAAAEKAAPEDMDVKGFVQKDCASPDTSLKNTLPRPPLLIFAHFSTCRRRVLLPCSVPWSGILRTDPTVRCTTPVITGLNYNVEVSLMAPPQGFG
ncbi:hypothetical protein BD779DRAFT_1679447 [Infundibulicybe gibba]|nr:hypothetical protein BD779DRAFT_1679447 [Infundibulicybe gibba]